MANRDCNGTFFTIIDERWYKCLLDGSLMKTRWFGSLSNGCICPNCKRTIEATDSGVAVQFSQFKVFRLEDGSSAVID